MASSSAESEDELDLTNFDKDRDPFEEKPPKKVEETRATLAYCLFALLTGVLAALFILLAAGKITSEGFSQVAGVVLSPVVGLLGAATGYYYGRGNK